jgi:hypothetical protein
MSNAERRILRRMKELSQTELPPQEVEAMMASVREALAGQTRVDADGTAQQPTLRPVPEASYGSAEGAQQGAPQGPSRRHIWRFLMKPSGRAVAASVVILVGVVALWAVLGRGASVAFADILQQLREVHTVKYKETLTCSMTGEPPSTSTSEVLVADRYGSRVTSSSGFIRISDLTPGRSLTLIPEKKSAWFMSGTGRGESEKPNLLDRVLKLDAQQAKAIGQKDFDGRLTDGFRVDGEGYIITFWIEPRTHLPVQVEEATRPGFTPLINRVMTDFQWNVPVDASLFNMTVPAGYEQSEMSYDASTPTEKDLVVGLKGFAEFNQGRFPDDFSMKGLMAAMQKAIKIGKDTIPQAERAKLAQKVAPIARQFAIAGNPTIGQDWHYAGKGIPLGQTGTPILWYKPKDSPTYRVIYADLAVADVQPADVPTGESVVMQPFPTPPAESKPQGPASQQAQ